MRERFRSKMVCVVIWHSTELRAEVYCFPVSRAGERAGSLLMGRSFRSLAHLDNSSLSTHVRVNEAYRKKVPWGFKYSRKVLNKIQSSNLVIRSTIWEV